MPVQDNEDSRKKEPEPVPEEPQNQAQDNIQKSGKMLPFLNAKAEQHTNRIDILNGKIATQESKITKHTAKIEKLTARADKLEDTNRTLKNMFGDNPLVQSFIKKNEQKIADIRENKIPNRQQKIKACQNKIGQLTAKRDIVQHKLNRVIALNDTIKSFTIGRNAERRAAFSSAINRLNIATIDCLSDKKAQLESKKNTVMKQYNAPETDVADKFKLQDKLNDLSAKINSVDEKIAKIKPDIKLAEKPPELVDATIKLTSDSIAEKVQDGNISIPEVSLDTVTAAQSVESLDKDKINELAISFPAENDTNQIIDALSDKLKCLIARSAIIKENILDAIQKIDNNECREIMVKRYLYQKSVAQISREMFMTRQGVYYHLGVGEKAISVYGKIEMQKKGSKSA